VYRQSAEAITTHRLRIIEAVKPPGYDAWAERARQFVKERPETFGENVDLGGVLIGAELRREKVVGDVEWDGEKKVPPMLAGSRSEVEKNARLRQIMKARSLGPELKGWETEPALEAGQIADIEEKIGGGLIEEVIQVAEGEHQLVDVMLESKAWEDLEEKPPQSQWDNFARDQHTPGTQEPPKGKN
ncbi:MAG: hypothetical protein Q9170_008383, partial [Blastenia crenularia]